MHKSELCNEMSIVHIAVCTMCQAVYMHAVCTMCKALYMHDVCTLCKALSDVIFCTGLSFKPHVKATMAACI